MSGYPVFPTIEPQVVYDDLCNSQNVTIACLQKFYGLDGYVSHPEVNNTFAISSYLKQWFNLDDLQRYLNSFAPYAVGAEYEVVLLDNGINSQDLSQEGSEAALDVQQALSLSYPAKGTYYSTGGSP